jgi:hypothetical protein
MATTRTPEQIEAIAIKKANREQDAAKAMREYQAEQARIDANTARLRALRLAREAADTAVVPAAKEKPIVKLKVAAARAKKTGARA